MTILPRLIRLHLVDVERIRPYLRDLEFLSREARTTRDLQVLITAVRVLALQSRTIAELLK